MSPFIIDNYFRFLDCPSLLDFNSYKLVDFWESLLIVQSIVIANMDMEWLKNMDLDIKVFRKVIKAITVTSILYIPGNVIHNGNF